MTVPPLDPAKPPLPEPEPEGPAPTLPEELGGAPGPEPTRYGDWEHKGRAYDF